MLAPLQSVNYTDDNGNPTGGHCLGDGLEIHWQNGPLGRDGNRIEPNGAFVETVIQAARQRLEYYQQSKFKCKENADAIHHLTKALEILDSRTKSREARKVEGTHEV